MEKKKRGKELNIEVFVARYSRGSHPFWAGKPESIGFFSEEEIYEGKDKKYGGTGVYSYNFFDEEGGLK